MPSLTGETQQLPTCQRNILWTPFSPQPSGSCVSMSWRTSGWCFKNRLLSWPPHFPKRTHAEDYGKVLFIAFFVWSDGKHEKWEVSSCAQNTTIIRIMTHGSFTFVYFTLSKAFPHMLFQSSHATTFWFTTKEPETLRISFKIIQLSSGQRGPMLWNWPGIWSGH